jgi:hypothetical protein
VNPLAVKTCVSIMSVALWSSSSIAFAQANEVPASNSGHGATPAQPQNSSLPSQLAENPSAAQSVSVPPMPPSPTQSQPSGTAAAPGVPVTGHAVSRPAGAAIAPRKQKQIRSILIRVGLIAGAAAAVGTVIALSKGSPSKPPGTR